MNFEQQTARPWQGASGGYLKNVAVFNSSKRPADSQSASIIARQVEAGLAIIHHARRAARASLSKFGRAHWYGVADDEANRLAALLHLRPPATVTPSRPGHVVPPSDGAIKRAFERHQKIREAERTAREAEAMMLAAWESRDMATWQAWESHWRAMSRALGTANELRGAE